MEVGRVGRALVAVAVIAVAMDGGSYTLASRHSLAIVVWWLVACAFALGLSEVKGARVPAAGLSLLAALGFAAAVAASVTWAANPEGAFLEFDRVLMYLGVGVLAALTPRRRVDVWADGCALGIGAVALLALISRLLPSLVAGHDLPQFLPGAAERLSYPLDYWNGLAVFLAIGTPLLLRAAMIGSPVFQAAAAAALPALVSATFLTASRTGAATLVLGAAVFVVLAADRWAAIATALLATAAAAVAIGVLLERPELVNGPLGGPKVAAEGRTAALLIVLICAATAMLNLSLQRRLPALPRPKASVGAAVAVATLAAGIALVGSSHPRSKLAAFTRPPALAAVSQPDFVQSHLLSAGGGGRWQFWRAAVSQFERHPLRGDGAGSYEAWWAQHGSLPVFVRYAHSLYLETLGELGLVGLFALLGTLASALCAGVIALAQAREHEQTTVAALLAAATAYLAAAGVDWMWQLTAVSVVGVACLGLLAAAGSEPARVVSRRTRRVFVRGLIVAAALLAIACEGLPLLTDAEVRASQAAAAGGDGARARTYARAAVALQSWAPSPYVQLALVDEQNQELGSAADAIHAALRRNARDWRSWLIAARIETKLGEIGRATRSLVRAQRLNPRSAIFSAERTGISARR